MEKVFYEWDIETVHSSSGDILDHHHADNLSELKSFKGDRPTESDTHYGLVLVRDIWDEDHGLMNREHWYPLEDEKTIFSNGLDVPKKYQAEFKKVWEN